MEPEHLNDIQSFHQSLKFARRQLLDLLQATYGHEPSWRNVRSRILKIFGRDGLESIFLQQREQGSGVSHGAKKKK